MGWLGRPIRVRKVSPYLEGTRNSLYLKRGEIRGGIYKQI
jgi:hypothetical protein